MLSDRRGVQGSGRTRGAVLSRDFGPPCTAPEFAGAAAFLGPAPSPCGSGGTLNALRLIVMASQPKDSQSITRIARRIDRQCTMKRPTFASPPEEWAQARGAFAARRPEPGPADWSARSPRVWNRWRPRGSLIETNNEWAFRGFRRATGATVPSTVPLHGAGVAGAHHRYSQRQAARRSLLTSSGLFEDRPSYTMPWGTTPQCTVTPCAGPSNRPLSRVRRILRVDTKVAKQGSAMDDYTTTIVTCVWFGFEW